MRQKPLTANRRKSRGRKSQISPFEAKQNLHISRHLAVRVIRNRHDGTTFSLADVFQVSGSRLAFENLIEKGCDRDWLISQVMRFHHWSAEKAGRSGLRLAAKQKRVLTRLLADLQEVESWHPFPILFAPNEHESLFFPVRTCRDYLERTLVAMPAIASRKYVNARALAVSSIVRHVKQQTGRPHYTELRILLDAALCAAGHTDLIHNDEAFSKMSELRAVDRVLGPYRRDIPPSDK